MRLTAGLAIGVIAASSTFAQDVISAHSGVVHYVEGRAFLGNDLLKLKVGQLPAIKETELFRTEDGRAEVLLTPGSFLRMQENSSVRMVSNRLTDTRIEMVSGVAMVECDDLPKDNAVMVLYKNSSIMLTKRGLYRISTEPAQFQVYDGEAIVKGDSSQVTLHSGKQTMLDGVLMAQSFDKKSGEDELYRWSSRRSEYLAKASVSSAMGLRNSYASNGLGGVGSGYGYGWQWNPMFGMYTFVPTRGILYSPFGWGFFSPYSAYNYYYSPTYYNTNTGGGSTGASSGFTPYSASQMGYDSGAARMSNAGGSYAGGSTGGGVAAASGGAASAAGGSARGGGGASAGGGGGSSRGR